MCLQHCGENPLIDTIRKSIDLSYRWSKGGGGRRRDTHREREREITIREGEREREIRLE